MISNKAAKECRSILLKYFKDSNEQLLEMLSELSKVKSNQSFHDSMQLLYDVVKNVKDKT